MRQPAARRFGAARINRAVAFLDGRDLSVLVDDERCAVRHACLRNQDSIILGNGAIGEIAQQRYGQVELGCKLFLRKRVIGADPKNFDLLTFEFSDTSLVRQKFLRSTRREGRREKCQHHGILSTETRKFHGLARGGT